MVVTNTVKINRNTLFIFAIYFTVIVFPFPYSFCYRIIQVKLTPYFTTYLIEQKDKMMGKYVFTFGNGKADGKADMKELLGGKGANLAEMTNLGISVPTGITLST